MSALVDSLHFPLAPAGATVFTNQIAGANLDELLEAAARNIWPNSTCTEEWLMLRTWAIQAESLMTDQAENAAWDERMRALNARGLPYEEWVQERLTALEERTRARKLAQTRLRYAYGFKQPRRWGLIARDVRRFHGQSASSAHAPCAVRPFVC